jgi:hypothetical protein
MYEEGGTIVLWQQRSLTGSEQGSVLRGGPNLAVAADSISHRCSH